ncbi:MAG TPA: hypothetical protein VGS19_36160 [Streptosporangiaceae bacterium]|nr:hypothetical protein [Streptosporangiaceae bacterium]
MDPLRGKSPWQRGVKDDRQVLVCPDCQTAPHWSDDLDHCPKCGSARLVRRLGEVECRDCGFMLPPGDADKPPEPADGAPGLAEEVALALERVLGRAGRKSTLLG